ncbi:gamma subclass chorismate mutase AroQ [Kosakonia oryzae]|uniref:chorismate mutase n=2 Tax=Kosakonia oryzae TaxID=497725 RepID=A0AA94KQ66_9ENTR|nr:gamma subclass chorismate mutase AroQ [Kosakonia oryzae]SFC22700.1 chorismate mutase [Kosakonia oryzae]
MKNFASTLLMSGSVFAGASASICLNALSLILTERMQIMRDVAAYKAKYRLPVEDLAREQKVLAAARNTAQEAGLEPHSVESFISALMTAGKTIQYRYLADGFAPADLSVTQQDLEGIRQRINELDKHLLMTISQRLRTGQLSYSERAWLAEKTVSPNLTEAEKDNLLDTMRFIQRAT